MAKTSPITTNSPWEVLKWRNFVFLFFLRHRLQLLTFNCNELTKKNSYFLFLILLSIAQMAFVNWSKSGRPFSASFVYFRLFQKQAIIATNQPNKMSIQVIVLDSNPRPSQHVSLPITTRPVANLIKPLRS